MNDQRPNRQSIRLPGYNYALPGAYFVTICTHHRQHLFGVVENGQVILSDWGHVAAAQWLLLPEHFPRVRIDEHVFMPNHMHGILWIDKDRASAELEHPVAVSLPAPRANDNRPNGAAAGSLGAIIGTFKSVTTRRINQLRRAPGMPVWQRNYFEHIVRTEEALQRIRSYIIDNPSRWIVDRYHSQPVGPDPFAVEIWRLLHQS